MTFIALLGSLQMVFATCSEVPRENRGSLFLGFTDFTSFSRTNTHSGEPVWISPVLPTTLNWDELILSWNVDPTKETRLIFEARGFQTNVPTRFYNLGRWSAPGSREPRESALGDKDEHGRVATDTLQLKFPADAVQVRITAEAGFELRRLNFLGISLSNTRVLPPALPPNKAAWGKHLPVPETSQMSYTNGAVLCSPATVSMLLAYWAEAQQTDTWRRDVPEIAAGVYDANWKGTGNWSFNMAFAGSLSGLRSYVTRLTDVSELEDLIAAGVPVGLSVCYNRLRGKGTEPSGHLVVCVGFTENGDVIVNDPGTSRGVRKTFPRRNLVDAWAHSRNTIYLLHPTGTSLPQDRFGHWFRP